MEEQSVLDFVIAYIRSLINPRRFPKPELEPATEKQPTEAKPQTLKKTPETSVIPEKSSWPGLPEIDATPVRAFEEAEIADDDEEGRRRDYRGGAIPWRSLLALLLALWAQRLLEPPNRSTQTALILYGIAGLVLIWAVLTREWVIVPHRKDSTQPMYLPIRPYLLAGVIGLMGLLLIVFGGNRFNPFNLLLWAVTLYYAIRAFRIPELGHRPWFKKWFAGLIGFFKQPRFNLRFSRRQILVAAVFLLSIFFRFYRLDAVPGEMFSDHAEKLLDVYDVLKGKTSIFFPRNTGREAIQMYLTAAVALLFGTRLSFMSLKIGTALVGLFTLPYIYKLGKEIGNRWVGLLAMALAGVAYWPNLIARIGLRFPLYPLFVAPVLFYLFRGIRTSNRNDMIWAGIALGLGLHGYSPMRIVPFVILILIGLYLLHSQARGKRWETLAGLLVLAFVSLIVFLPLLRYMIDDPQMFAFRAFTRMGTTERNFPAPVAQLFFSNLWKAMIMFFWDNGRIWVHSVIGRPALDVVTAALFFLGMLLLILRYIRQRHWADLWLLVSIPLLMMPSILSLAFPDENPSLNRTGGAIIPVFIVAAIALESFLAGFYSRMKNSLFKAVPVLIGVILFCVSAAQNYDLVINQFERQFMAGALNTSEIGQVIRGFSESVGDPDSAYVVPYPYWVDTRLVGINAGYPLKDFALWPKDFPTTLSNKGTKLFVLKPEDQESLRQLNELYPDNVSWLYHSRREGKDFYLFFVPGKPGLKNLP